LITVVLIFVDKMPFAHEDRISVAVLVIKHWNAMLPSVSLLYASLRRPPGPLHDATIPPTGNQSRRLG